jgi:hypothetical protein
MHGGPFCGRERKREPISIFAKEWGGRDIMGHLEFGVLELILQAGYKGELLGT